MSRPNLSASLRRLRALRVAVGVHRFRFRALDVHKKGRPACMVPKIASSFPEALQRCHTWLRFNRPAAKSWWFSVEELAFDESGRYSVVVNSKDVLVYAQTLWDGCRPSFIASDRREVVNG